MLRAMIVGCGLLLSGMFTQAAQADGLFRKVPRVGEWARYFVEIGADDEASQTAKLTIECAKSETIENARHLWMNVTLDDVGEERLRVIVRLLVPEDRFESGKNPIEHIVRGVIQIGTQTRQLDEEMLTTIRNEEDGAVFWAMGAKLVDPGTLDRRKVVKCQQGNLECRGRRALMQMSGDNDDPPVVVIHWESEKAVWGVAAIEIEGKLDDADTKFSIEYQEGGVKDAAEAGVNRS